MRRSSIAISSCSSSSRCTQNCCGMRGSPPAEEPAPKVDVDAEDGDAAEGGGGGGACVEKGGPPCATLPPPVPTAPCRQLARKKNSWHTKVMHTRRVSHRSCGFMEQPTRPSRKSLRVRASERTPRAMLRTREELRVPTCCAFTEASAFKKSSTAGLMREEVVGTATWVLPSETVMWEGSSFAAVVPCPDSTECELLWNGGAPMQPMLLRAPLAGSSSCWRGRSLGCRASSSAGFSASTMAV
mmetsp:Transcript_10733/g.29476  ORF Transcript_10733/g.29476 Transcript_10733/m.29476 type:complete len:242 (+) Transcript_10733:1724-2449(+)